MIWQRMLNRFSAAAWAVASLLATVASAQSTPLTVERSEAGAKVQVGGEPFAEYVTRSGHQPIVWPIHGPDGSLMTRSYPMTAPQPHEKDDHPHHRSLWFNHGVVNGHDFWAEPRKAEQILIEHREFESLESLSEGVRIVTVNDWLAGEEKVCEDRRTLAFGAVEDRRWIDFTVEVKATESAVEFGDTKEGSFGIRVPGTMKVEANQGGRFVNSRGQVDGDAWGQPAPWINYTGPVDGKPAGIAVFSHPSNFRPECRWHVREYGLLAANPFGLKDFTKGALSQAALTLAPGASLELRYLVLFHRGDLSDEELQSEFDRFATSP